MSGMNKIPNSDIIGYEGPVGYEKAIHKNQFTSLGVRMIQRQEGDEKVMNGVRYVWHGKWKLKETRMTGRESAED